MPAEPQKLYHIRHRTTLKYAALLKDGRRVWLRFSKRAIKLRGGATLDTLLLINKAWMTVEAEPDDIHG